MKTSNLLILAAGLMAATTVRWAELRGRRTLGDIYREARTGRLRISAYRKVVTVASLILMLLGLYLAVSGD